MMLILVSTDVMVVECAKKLAEGQREGENAGARLVVNLETVKRWPSHFGSTCCSRTAGTARGMNERARRFRICSASRVSDAPLAIRMTPARPRPSIVCPGPRLELFRRRQPLHYARTMRCECRLVHHWVPPPCGRSDYRSEFLIR